VIYQYLTYQNARDYDGIEKIHHNPYYNFTYFGRHPIDPKAHTRALRGYFKIFPDATTEANQIVAVEGNKVVVRTTARGTQHLDLLGGWVGEKGKQIAVSLMHVIEVIDGKIASCESTNPFENQWEAEIITGHWPLEADFPPGFTPFRHIGAGNINRDNVGRSRAAQGIDSNYEYLLVQLHNAYTGGRINDTEMKQLRRQLDAGPNQCQALIPQFMRRCAKQAMPWATGRTKGKPSIYCTYHQTAGYGID
jgi:predicted ester cyclase